MNTIEKMEYYHTAPRKETGVARNSYIWRAIDELLEFGIARTGYSTRRTKRVWTAEVVQWLTNHGFKVVAGNDAPRGGACGEFVKIDCKAFNNAVLKAQEERRRAYEERKRLEEEERAAIAAAKAAIEARREELKRTLQPSLTPEMWAVRAEELAKIPDDIHGLARREARKKARKTASQRIYKMLGEPQEFSSKDVNLII